MLFRGKKADQADRRDWVDDATDTIQRFVDTVHDAAVVPLTTIVRAVVYGILIAIVGVAALVIASILLVRLLDVYLDNIPWISHDVWVADLVGGGIFVVAGMFFWSKRSPKRSDREA